MQSLLSEVREPGNRQKMADWQHTFHLLSVAQKLPNFCWVSICLRGFSVIHVYTMLECTMCTYSLIPPGKWRHVATAFWFKMCHHYYCFFFNCCWEWDHKALEPVCTFNIFKNELTYLFSIRMFHNLPESRSISAWSCLLESFSIYLSPKVLCKQKHWNGSAFGEVRALQT